MTNVQAAAEQQAEKQQKSPGALVYAYRDSLALMLPSHVRADTWVRLAQSALMRGEKRDGEYVLVKAARNNPDAFMQAVKTCAMLGLQPGTDEFYLTPRKNKHNGNREEILGIVGYQGYIELMHRAGAVESVVAEVVREGDRFQYQPGVDTVPQHGIDWDDDERDDKPLRLVYAYANMRGGAVSKVVVLGRGKIEKIKKSSASATTEYSPWTTNPESMWLKSAVRQLRKWVPTSAEYRDALRGDTASAIEAQNASRPGTATVDMSTGELLEEDDGGVVDAEVVEE